ncbi:MAG TPA: hypothetical protein VI485_10630 [Vicinamibacterales bacterium]|nr:hypothetical protein [Vicinamibacterales bacterium]
MSQVATVSVNGPVLSEVDRLFATLDGVRVSNGLGEWNSRIQGIYADGPYVWVQLSRDDAESQSVVLRLPRETTVVDIMHALQSVRFEDPFSAQFKKVLLG